VFPVRPATKMSAKLQEKCEDSAMCDGAFTEQHRYSHWYRGMEVYGLWPSAYI
jgi:hypothetical protein